MGSATHDMISMAKVRGSFQTTFVDHYDVRGGEGGRRGSGAVTLLLTTRVEHVSACPIGDGCGLYSHVKAYSTVFEKSRSK